VESQAPKVGEAIVQYIDDRPDVYDVRRQMNDLIAAFEPVDASSTQASGDGAGAIETGASDSPASVEATFDAGGGDFGGGGATGDFSAT
jgi:uncharacterized membrane protein YgcG